MAEDGTPPALETRGLTVRFGGRAVLDRIDIRIRRGETYVVMGPSGCGKTTLLKCLVRLLPPTEGSVLVDGRDVAGLGPEESDDLRRATGMVFQNGALLNSISLRENVALPMRAHLDMPPGVVEEAVRMKLAQVGLLEAADRMPAELSGGMRKRAGIARALALDPRLVFFDEPTSGLDPVTSDGMDNLVLELKAALGATMVVVTHDLPSARKIADRLVVLSRGRALAEGTWDEVQATTDPEVRGFLDRHAEPPVIGEGATPLVGAPGGMA
ncbi:MAG: ABC transporter ATP-binding protein [Planctomycetaceae bacterium]|nr:ABC transporter ATP-binding protein [Planctomycetota bacterium]NUN52735.1 ABC transporter ATP-binding protein [Planctomycetaceae bacterium]